jgi:glycosyltransferase involved in cell wall biosynthesis
VARVVYFYREMSEYIRIDLDLLRERHEVTVVECRSRWPHPLRTWRQIGAHDLAMTWFASWHALLPALCCRLRGRPMVVTVGGYDTACLPGIGYGNHRGRFKRAVTLAVMRLATRLLSISLFSQEETVALGVPARKVDRLFLGLDPALYPDPGKPREALVTTVGGVNASNLARKGLEAFVRAAALVPEARFVVVGAWMDDAVERLRTIATPNVVFTGRVGHAGKVDWLWRSRVVVQASQHEAFGLSLAEGMLCGAVPVVTAAGALPEVAGDAGVVLADQDPRALADGVRRALRMDDAAGARARERVLEWFSIPARRRGLHALVDGLLGARGAGAGPAPADREDVRRAA